MPLIAHVDEISRSGVAGWAVDTDRPDELVSVSVLVDGVHRGMCRMTDARPSLVLPPGARPAGKYGFHFAFEPPLSPFVALRIDVVETWSAQALPNGSLILPAPRLHCGDGA